MTITRRCILFVLFVMTAEAPSIGWSQIGLPDNSGGPTPYPSRDQDWPGVGPVRLFGWMTIYRKQFFDRRNLDRGAIVLAGDSLTQGWTERIANFLSGLRIANRGIGGDVSRGLLFRLREDVLELKPAAIVLLIGTNDLTARATPSQIVSNLHSIVEICRTLSVAPIILTTIPPVESPVAPINDDDRRMVNRSIAAIAAATSNARLVDLSAVLSDGQGRQNTLYFANDRVHLSDAGYEVWAGLLQPILSSSADRRGK